MRVGIVVNRSSGRGRAVSVASRLERAVASDGHDVGVAPIGPNADPAGAYAAAKESDALIVVGGDGTVHALADHAANGNTPVYHVPTGTENLFAREFGMDRDIARVRTALADARTRDVDLAHCNGRSFVIMCSVGFDANVIRRVDARRNGTISHATYVQPIVSELLSLDLPLLSVSVDNEKVVDVRRGLLVIANSRQYALRLDPAREAVLDDGLLDVVFHPHEGRRGLAALGVSALLGRHHRSRSRVHARGKRIVVTSHSGVITHQIDGENGMRRNGVAPKPTTRLEIDVNPRALSVLLPRSA